jgi:hypothetical protein
MVELNKSCMDVAPVGQLQYVDEGLPLREQRVPFSGLRG